MAPVGYLLYASLLLAVVVYVRTRRRSLPFPPGPPAESVIGHLRVLPPVDQVDVFQEWAAKYGDIFYLNVLGQSIVVLNKYQAAADLLDKRSANFSDRAKCVSYDLMGWKRSSAVLPCDPTWRKHRKMYQEY
ncbi:cytochrome P450 [Sparassis latifolia]